MGSWGGIAVLTCGLGGVNMKKIVKVVVDQETLKRALPLAEREKMSSGEFLLWCLLFYLDYWYGVTEEV